MSNHLVPGAPTVTYNASSVEFLPDQPIPTQLRTIAEQLRLAAVDAYHRREINDMATDLDDIAEREEAQ